MLAAILLHVALMGSGFGHAYGKNIFCSGFESEVGLHYWDASLGDPDGDHDHADVNAHPEKCLDGGE